MYLTNDFINWADWVNDFCMLMVMEYFWFYGQSTLCLLHLNAGWPVQLYLAGSPPSKKKKVFSILKFCHWLLLEALNKIWYYLFYCTNPSMSGKILIVELLLETLSTSQIAGFCDCWWNESPDISPDGMTGSLWCYACRQIAGRGKRIYTFFIGYGAQTLLKSSVSLEIV